MLEAAVDQQRLREENAELRAQLRDRFSFDSIIGRDSTMQQLFSTLELVAPMNSTVLIQGETGTGKELDRAHDPSPLARAPTSDSSRSTPRRFPKAWPKPSCSAT